MYMERNTAVRKKDARPDGLAVAQAYCVFSQWLLPEEVDEFSNEPNRHQ